MSSLCITIVLFLKKISEILLKLLVVYAEVVQAFLNMLYKGYFLLESKKLQPLHIIVLHIFHHHQLGILRPESTSHRF